MSKKAVAFRDFNDGTIYRLWQTCACGCGEVVRNLFAQGHDMKLKSQQLQAKNLNK